jgi:molecular chaperone GrpE (heat shock protein)
MPNLLAEAMKAVNKDAPKKKKDKPVAEVEVSTDSDKEDSEASSEKVVSKGCNYTTFNTCGPPSFDGTEDAVATQQWLREMESVIRISECKEEQKVKFASHSFVSKALCWWDNLVQAIGEKAVQRMK